MSHSEGWDGHGGNWQQWKYSVLSHLVTEAEGIQSMRSQTWYLHHLLASFRSQDVLALQLEQILDLHPKFGVWFLWVFAFWKLFWCNPLWLTGFKAHTHSLSHCLCVSLLLTLSLSLSYTHTHTCTHTPKDQTNTSMFILKLMLKDWQDFSICSAKTSATLGTVM